MPPILALNGPTASGKSALAVDVAVALASRGIASEIVNADSMLVYRGMDIGTAKPSVAERRGVPHHLIDILEVTDTASVADFQALARGAIADCHRQAIVPILVGGSALYVRAILDVFEFPGTDPTVRAHWEAELASRGAESLHQELIARAPQVASDILPGNGRRIVRALEVLELTGSFVPTLPSWTYALPGVVSYGLRLPRDVMDARIAERVLRMWAAGLVEEVHGLLPRGLRDGRTASKALGYRQVLDFLDGRCTEAEAEEATISRTRRFARNQLGWFRRDPRIVWREANDPANASALADAVETALTAS